jgi:predicted ester cyclase
MPLPEEKSQEEKNKIKMGSFINEIFNNHDLSSLEKNFGHGSIKSSTQVQEFSQFLSDFFNAFPDWRAKIEHIIAENNLVVVFLNGSGTHKGKFRGVEPTDRKVNIRSADLYRIENEKITGHWDVIDQLDLLKQTGTLLFGRR